MYYLLFYFALYSCHDENLYISKLTLTTTFQMDPSLPTTHSTTQRIEFLEDESDGVWSLEPETLLVSYTGVVCITDNMDRVSVTSTLSMRTIEQVLYNTRIFTIRYSTLL